MLVQKGKGLRKEFFQDWLFSILIPLITHFSHFMVQYRQRCRVFYDEQGVWRNFTSIFIYMPTSSYLKDRTGVSFVLLKPQRMKENGTDESTIKLKYDEKHEGLGKKRCSLSIPPAIYSLLPCGFITMGEKSGNLGQ